MKTSETVKRLIKSRQALLGYSNEEMACRMRMSVSSWNRRMRYPNLINVEELIKLEKILKMSFLTEV